MESLISCDSFSNAPNHLGFATNISYFRKNRILVDVTFLLETQSGETVEIYAHQLILSLRSSKFEDMFFGEGVSKGDKVITLRKTNPKTFEKMIRYCYNVEPDIESTKEACALFRLASEYKLFSLMSSCRKYLDKIKIEPRNVFIMLEVAENMQDKDLKNKCYTFLKTKTREVISSYKLSEVTPVMVHFILELPELSLSSEYELLEWLFDWAKEKVKEGDSFCTNTREYLEKLLQDMNFLALELKQFASLCRDNPCFFSLEEIGMVFMNIAFPGSREMPDWYDKDLKFRGYTGKKSFDIR